MKCTVIQSNMTRYLEDVLPEEEHRIYAEHLIGCQGCKQFAESVGSFASELKKIGERQKITFDLMPILQNVLNRPPKKFSISKKWLATIVSIGVGAAVIFTVKTLYENKQQSIPVEEKKNPEPVVSDPTAEYYINQLRTIENQLKSAASSQQKITQLTMENAVPITVTLEPIHFDLGFKSDENRNQIRATIAKYKPQIHHDSWYAIIFSLSSEKLSALFAELNMLPVIRQNDLHFPGALPTSEQPVRVSMTLAPHEWTAGEKAFFHWHFNFLLRNPYIFAERVKQAGIQLKYEASEVMVLNLSPQELPQLIEVMKGFSGLQYNFETEDLSKKTANAQKIEIVLYLTES